jgi:hypothetical protein
LVSRTAAAAFTATILLTYRRGLLPSVRTVVDPLVLRLAA